MLTYYSVRYSCKVCCPGVKTSGIYDAGKANGQIRVCPGCGSFLSRCKNCHANTSFKKLADTGCANEQKYECSHCKSPLTLSEICEEKTIIEKELPKSTTGWSACHFDGSNSHSPKE